MNEFDDDIEMDSNEPSIHTHSTSSRPKATKRARRIIKYSQLKMREGLVRFIASADLPITFAEDPKFEEFVKTYINPAFTRVSIDTIKSDCFRIFNETKKNIIFELSNVNAKVSCTSSIWSSCNGLSYICVTVHYIDSSWTLHKKVIGFRMLEYPLNADNIFQITMSIFREYGIFDKVFSITFDNHNAINNDAIEMVRHALHPSHMGQFYHGKCASHIISLIVKDGLKIMDMLIDKIRNAIIFISLSPTRQLEFCKLCRMYSLKAKKVKSDIHTRWNSTYLMLESCLNYHEVINDYISERYSDNVLSQKDWELAFTFGEFLKVFYVATNDFSNVYYPTSCIFLIQMYDISHAFSMYRENGILADICNVMEEKFKKYWEFMPPIFCLAAVMDPRISLTGVEVLLNGISKNLNMSLSITVDDVKNLITSVFTTYESKYANKTKTTSTSLPSSSSTSSAWTLLGKLRKQKVTASSELQKYLEIDFRVFLTDEEVENFDILSWWKSQQGIFPILSIMARDLLTAPVSTVASDSAFHEFNRELDERKSRLSAKMVDCLMCLKDWEHARLRIQNQKDDIIDDFANLYIDDDDE